MKNFTYFLSIIALTALFVSCGEDDDANINSLLGVSYNGVSSAGNVEGSIVNQNDGPKVNYVTDSAYVQQVDGDLYVYKLHFDTSDSLTMYLQKLTPDYNYHSDAEEGQNLLVTAVFNADTLEMEASAVSIQPRENEVFHTVTNLHTVSRGDYNGTVNQVP